MIINGDVLIRVEDIHKVFDDSLHALNGVSEEISKGEVVVIVGPSGSGKSTFLRSLNLLEVPTTGHIYFEGSRPILTSTARRWGWYFSISTCFPIRPY